MFLSGCPVPYLVEVALAGVVLAEVLAGLALETLQVWSVDPRAREEKGCQWLQYFWWVAKPLKKKSLM